jgi:hypothetical protein
VDEVSLVLRLLVLFLSCLFLIHSPLSADIESSLELLPVYFIAVVQGEGNVQVLKEGETQWRKAGEGTRLEEGDRILAGDDTEVILSLQSETLIHLDEDTEMTVARLEGNNSDGFISRLRLLTGSLLCDVKKNLSQSGSKFEVDAGGVVCGVKGTVFEVASNSDPVRILTEEGEVQVKSAGGSRLVPAGDTCWASKGRFPSLYPSSEKTKARFQAWRDIRHKILQKQHESGLSQAKISLPIGHDPWGKYRLGPNDISAEPYNTGGKSPDP